MVPIETTLAKAGKEALPKVLMDYNGQRRKETTSVHRDDCLPSCALAADGALRLPTRACPPKGTAAMDSPTASLAEYVFACS